MSSLAKKFAFPRIKTTTLFRAPDRMDKSRKRRTGIGRSAQKERLNDYRALNSLYLKVYKSSSKSIAADKMLPPS